MEKFKNCQLALVGLFNGDHWKFRKELTHKEMKRMERRFEKDILYNIRYSIPKMISLRR
jgi:hypothetical protein